MSLSHRQRKKANPLEEGALYRYAVEALGRRMQSVADLKRRMRAKVEPGEEGENKIAAVIARLEEQHYLDDSIFASTYARLRQDNDSFGRRRVERELTRRGIQADLIVRTLDSAYEDVHEEELARRYLSRKRIPRPKSEKEIARLMRRLLTAGFSFPVISTILKSWELEVDEAELAALEEFGNDPESSAS